jgi:hypothetical protein
MARRSACAQLARPSRSARAPSVPESRAPRAKAQSRSANPSQSTSTLAARFGPNSAADPGLGSLYGNDGRAEPGTHHLHNQPPHSASHLQTDRVPLFTVQEIDAMSTARRFAVQLPASIVHLMPLALVPLVDAALLGAWCRARRDRGAIERV